MSYASSLRWTCDALLIVRLEVGASVDLGHYERIGCFCQKFNKVLSKVLSIKNSLRMSLTLSVSFHASNEVERRLCPMRQPPVISQALGGCSTQDSLGWYSFIPLSSSLCQE